MSKTINGLTISVNFCNKINCTPIPANEVSKGTPLANIYKQENTTNSYVVNIVSHVPTNIEPDTPKFPENAISLDNDTGCLYLSYNGLQEVNTPMNQGNVNCRVFWFEFNATENAQEFNLYHTQFVYSIDSSIAGSAEAILVQERNDDPRTDRGTVTTTSGGN